MKKGEGEDRGKGWGYNGMVERTSNFLAKFKFSNRK